MSHLEAGAKIEARVDQNATTNRVAEKAAIHKVRIGNYEKYEKENKSDLSIDSFCLRI